MKVEVIGKIPKYMTNGAAAFDLPVDIPEPKTIYCNELVQLSTGLALKIPEGYEGRISRRSSGRLGRLIIPNAPGIVDSDYRDIIYIWLFNPGEQAITIRPGDRVAQMVITPVIRVEFEKVEEFSPDINNNRVGGFGSTGR